MEGPIIVALIVLLYGVGLPSCLYRSGKYEEQRETRLRVVASAPLPAFPLQFEWSGWMVGFMAGGGVLFGLPIVGLSISILIRYSWVSSIEIFFFVVALVLFSFLAMQSIGLIYRYFSGPAFLLTREGIAHAGKQIRWEDISSVRYTGGGQSLRVVFALKGHKMISRWRGVFHHSEISVSAALLKDPDGLIGYSRRILTNDVLKGPILPPYFRD